MKMYYVYIVRCSDDSYYTGVTNDPARRLDEHNHGVKPDSYTYRRRPVELVFQQGFNDPEHAVAFEKQLKGWSRKKKEAVINGTWELLPGLSLNKENRLRQAQPDNLNRTNFKQQKTKYNE